MLLRRCLCFKNSSVKKILNTVKCQPIRNSAYDVKLEYLEPISNKEDVFKPKLETDPYKYKPIKAALSETNFLPNYDPLVKRFIRHFLRKGDKNLSKYIIDKTFENIKIHQLCKYNSTESEEARQQIELNPRLIFHNAIENCKPLLNLQKVHRGGVIYNVPVPVTENYKIFKAFYWIREAAMEKTPNQRIWDTLSNELLDAAKNEGKAIRKKIELLRTCEANRAYAHYRW